MILKFFRATKYLWIVSRIILIILFGVTISSNALSSYDTPDLVSKLMFLIPLILMILVSIFEILKKEPHYVLRFLVGIFHVCIGLLMSYLLLTLAKGNHSVYAEIGFQFLPIWIILYGIFEIVNGINSSKKALNT